MPNLPRLIFFYFRFKWLFPIIMFFFKELMTTHINKAGRRDINPRVSHHYHQQTIYHSSLNAVNKFVSYQCHRFTTHESGRGDAWLWPSAALAEDDDQKYREIKCERMLCEEIHSLRRKWRPSKINTSIGRRCSDLLAHLDRYACKGFPLSLHFTSPLDSFAPARQLSVAFRQQVSDFNSRNCESRVLSIRIHANC